MKMLLLGSSTLISPGLKMAKLAHALWLMLQAQCSPPKGWSSHPQGSVSGQLGQFWAALGLTSTLHS